MPFCFALREACRRPHPIPPAVLRALGLSVLLSSPYDTDRSSRLSLEECRRGVSCLATPREQDDVGRHACRISDCAWEDSSEEIAAESGRLMTPGFPAPPVTRARLG